MDIITALKEPNFDYQLVHAFFEEKSTFKFMVDYLKEDTPSNRKALKREVEKLMAASPQQSAAISTNAIRRAKAEKQLGDYIDAPTEIREIVHKKNYTYRMLADRFSQLKALVFKELDNQPSQQISLLDALNMMKSVNMSGQAPIFSITYITIKGEIVVYSSCMLNKLANKMLATYKHLNHKNRPDTNTRYWKEKTRRIFLPKENTIKSVRINQIITFNDMEVVWT